MGSEQSALAKSGSIHKSKSASATPDTSRSPSPSPRSRHISPSTGRFAHSTSDLFADPPPPYAPRTANSTTTQFQGHLLRPDPAPRPDGLQRSASATLSVPSHQSHRRSASASSAARRDAGSAHAAASTRLQTTLAVLGTEMLLMQTAVANSQARLLSPNPGNPFAGSSSAAPRSRPVSAPPRPVVSKGSPERAFGPVVVQASSKVSNPSSRSPTSPTITVTGVPIVQAVKRRTSGEDPLLLLRKYDTVIIVDDSMSMEGSRWREARDALAGVIEVASSYNIDGIDLYFLNDRRVGHNLKSSTDLIRLFDQVVPSGYTPTGEKLEELLLAYLEKIEGARAFAQAGAAHVAEVKPVNFIVLTDGAASDDPETPIVAAARRLDSQHFPLSQVGIQFVQIGEDAEAKAFLEELDDALAASHGIRDMVDTTPYTGNTLTADTLAKILIGGINRRVDKRGL